MNKSNFRNLVYDLVGQIPKGRVMTYGQIASICGIPRAARIVGQIAHFGPEDLPWHRVVRQDGGLASGYPGGMKGQQKDLESEGIKVENYKINVDVYLWKP